MSERENFTVFSDRWRVVRSGPAGLFNLVDSLHPLEIYIGANSAGEATLSVVLKTRPPTVARFESLSIEQRRREDGSWLLLLQLQSASSFREFSNMCFDLVESSRSEPSEDRALERLLQGLDRWRRLFRPSEDQRLSERRLRGLIAELTCMTKLLKPSRSWDEVVRGWVGPADAPQDFRLSSNWLVEVKSVHLDSTSVSVSSLAQLDRKESKMLLVTVVVERENDPLAESSSPSDLVRDIEQQLIGDFDLLDEFRSKLAEIGFNSADPAYDDFRYRTGSLTVYEVDALFPRVKREDVPSDVLLLEYELSLLGLHKFEKSFEEFGSETKWS